jgi:hypothetical protein
VKTTSVSTAVGELLQETKKQKNKENRTYRHTDRPERTLKRHVFKSDIFVLETQINK